MAEYNKFADSIRFLTSSDPAPASIAAGALALINSVLGKIAAYVNSSGQLICRYGGSVPKIVTDVSADGAITIQHGNVLITKGTAAALTLASPTAGLVANGGHDGIEISFVSSTAAAHTITCTAGFGGGTTARDVATFGGAIQDGMRIFAYNGVWYVKDTRNVTLA